MRRRISAAASSLHRHSLPQLLMDGALVALAYFLAFQLRWDNGPPGYYGVLRDRTIWWAVLAAMVVLSAFHVYQRRLRYTSVRDLESLVLGVLATTVLLYVAIEVIRPVERGGRHHLGTATVGLPNGVTALFLLLTLLFLCGTRVLARAFHDGRLSGLRHSAGGRAVLIVGAGDGGRLVLREILRNPGLGLKPIGFLDDDEGKRGARVDGVRVRGNAGGDLPRILDEAKPDEVILAVPSAPGTLRARVVRACRERGIPVRTLPTVFELLQDGGTLVRQVREVRVEDVLGREPVHVELERVGAYLRDRVVLVTGAGGSIGSELCRQIARVGARRLLLLDHAEDNLFAIQRELLYERHVHPSALGAVLADCREGERMREVFAEHAPSVVFHAAAYKHVALMEANPLEAVRNNAIATRIVADIAGEHGAEHFVLVSTDKAVAPATVMGASKALAELALEAASAGHPQTEYAAVRFGNVLGSSGSVVPIFRRQIAEGGPVTITDRRMARYFMTIPEAVQLIIRAGSLTRELDGGHGPAIFVLEMGEPISIYDLACQMIELCGLAPGRDVAIEEIGAHPGEKLCEQLFNEHETPRPTGAEKILLADRSPLSPEAVEQMFDEINLLVLEGDATGLAAKVAELSRMHRSGDRRQRIAERGVDPQPVQASA